FFLQIFRLVFPVDLLQLARTNKGFRNILMKRSSASIWRVARTNIPGLPAPFPGMSEPTWANLLFFKSCEICTQKTTAPINWLYRVRLCMACAVKE
ncbi:hypothetical protein EDD85DRAFT_781943, partial [Armillaria nabsnona]